MLIQWDSVTCMWRWAELADLNLESRWSGSRATGCIVFYFVWSISVSPSFFPHRLSRAAHLLSRYRPRCPIIAITRSPQVQLAFINQRRVCFSRSTTWCWWLSLSNTVLSHHSGWLLLDLRTIEQLNLVRKKNSQWSVVVLQGKIQINS